MRLLKVGIRQEGKQLQELRQKLLASPYLQSKISIDPLAGEHRAQETTHPDSLFVAFKLLPGEIVPLLTQLTEAGLEISYLSYQADTPNLHADETGPALSAENKAQIMNSFETSAQKMSHLKGDLLESLLKNPAPQNRKINLPTLNGFRRFDLSTIIRCESAENYTTVHFTDRKKILVCRTLQEFETKLAGFGFFRVHHKHLINTEHIVEYQRGKGGQIILTDNSSIDVSVRKKSDFIRYINDFS